MWKLNQKDMSEQFAFGREHIGRPVKHKNGHKGRIIDASYVDNSPYALVIHWGGRITSYTKYGTVVDGEEVVIFLDEPETDLRETKDGPILHQSPQVPGPILRLPEQPVIMPAVVDRFDAPTFQPYRAPENKAFPTGTNYIGPNDQPEKVITSPTLKNALVEHFGRITERAEQHQDTEPAPENDYEETPFIPNRAEVWARFMAASMTAGEPAFSAANIADQALTFYEARFFDQ